MLSYLKKCCKEASFIYKGATNIKKVLIMIPQTLGHIILNERRIVQQIWGESFRKCGSIIPKQPRHGPK